MESNFKLKPLNDLKPKSPPLPLLTSLAHSDMCLLYSSCTSVLEHSSPVRLCLWCRNVVMHQFRNEKRKRKRKNNYPTAEYAIHNFSSKFGIRTTTELGGKQVVCHS